MPSIHKDIVLKTDNGYSNRNRGNGNRYSHFGTRTSMAVGRGPVYDAWMGARFQSINIPQGATITSATLTLTKLAVAGTPTPKIYGNDIDDAPTWGVGNQVRLITKTSATTNLDVASAVSVNNVTSIVQEIVNRAGWAPNNDIAFGIFTVKVAGSHYWLAYQANTTNLTSPPSNWPQLDIVYVGTGRLFRNSSLSGTSPTGQLQFNPSLGAP